MWYRNFKERFQSNQAVTIAVVGDSTTSGFGANPSQNTWTNGIEYSCVNAPRYGENWCALLADGVTPNPVYINTTGFPSQEQQDNVNIPSAVRLLRTEAETRNASSKVYNYGGSGWTALDHRSGNTIPTIANLTPKPELVILNLGINSAKNNLTQDDDLNYLIRQVISYGMIPVLAKPNNIGVAYSPSGNWDIDSYPLDWCPMDNWYQIRNGIDILGKKYGLDVIDLGTPTLEVDITKQYDSFHPNHFGYQAIADKYIAWLDSDLSNTVNTEITMHLNNANVDTLTNKNNGELAIKTSNGIIRLKLSQNTGTGLFITTSLGTYEVAK